MRLTYFLPPPYKKKNFHSHLVLSQLTPLIVSYLDTGTLPRRALPTCAWNARTELFRSDHKCRSFEILISTMGTMGFRHMESLTSCQTHVRGAVFASFKSLIIHNGFIPVWLVSSLISSRGLRFRLMALSYGPSRTMTTGVSNDNTPHIQGFGQPKLPQSLVFLFECISIRISGSAPLQGTWIPSQPS